MVNRSISERVAMTITGHKTRAVFDPYHIVSPADLQEAARKLVAHRHPRVAVAEQLHDRPLPDAGHREAAAASCQRS
jgi:hypothetical protein